MLSGNNIAIVTAFLYSIIFPVGMLIWWKKRTGVSLWCFIAGAVCFPVFALVLENQFHGICLGGNNQISEVILASPVLFTLYASFSAGVFEETARLFGFKLLLKNHEEKECAVAYGIGHGGSEIIVILGVNYLFLALAQMSVKFGTETATATLLETAKMITFTNAGLAMFERISAMMLQIGLSMIMFAASKEKGKLWLYPVAILLHAFVDAPASLYQYQAIHSIAVVEVHAFILGLLYLQAGKRILDHKQKDSWC